MISAVRLKAGQSHMNLTLRGLKERKISFELGIPNIIPGFEIYLIFKLSELALLNECIPTYTL